MEYGDKIIVNRFWGVMDKYTNIIYRFRIDPVPFIHNYKGWFGYGYKTPKSTQERRMSYAHEEYVRSKRRDNNLPNSWNDYLRADIRTRRSWKKRHKVRKQWMKYEKGYGSFKNIYENDFRWQCIF